MPPQKSSDSSPTPDSRHAKPIAVRAGLGRHVFGLGIMAIGLACLVWGDFITGQPVPNDFPHRIALAYTVAAFLVCIGIIMQWRRSASFSAAALAAYYVVIVIIIMHGPVLLAHFKEYGTYEGLAEQFAITAAALIVFAATARIPASLAARLTLLGQLTFGLCALIFGGAHFVYMNFTAPLVPKWLPPSQVFWGYLTGVAFILAGLAILSRIQGRLAAILLTVMLATFTLLVHIRILFADHKIQFNWTELAINLAILGAAWLVADSLTSPNPQPS
jgi:uncharacterized membrane protein